jgi:hypothetical protein
MSSWWPLDVVVAQHHFPADDHTSDGNQSAQRRDLRTRRHDQGHKKKDDQRGHALDEETYRWPRVHVWSRIADAEGL